MAIEVATEILGTALSDAQARRTGFGASYDQALQSDMFKTGAAIGTRGAELNLEQPNANTSMNTGLDVNQLLQLQSLINK